MVWSAPVCGPPEFQARGCRCRGGLAYGLVHPAHRLTAAFFGTTLRHHTRYTSGSVEANVPRPSPNSRRPSFPGTEDFPRCEPKLANSFGCWDRGREPKLRGSTGGGRLAPPLLRDAKVRSRDREREKGRGATESRSGSVRDWGGARWSPPRSPRRGQGVEAREWANDSGSPSQDRVWSS